MIIHIAFTPDRNIDRVTDGNNVSLACFDCVEKHFLLSSSEVENYPSIKEARKGLGKWIDKGRHYEPRSDCPHTK